MNVKGTSLQILFKKDNKILSYFEQLCVNKFSSLVKDKNSLKNEIWEKIENLNGLKSIKNI